MLWIVNYPDRCSLFESIHHRLAEQIPYKWFEKRKRRLWGNRSPFLGARKRARLRSSISSGFSLDGHELWDQLSLRCKSFF